MKDAIDFTQFTRVADTHDQEEANWLIDHGWTLLDAGRGHDSETADSFALYVLGWRGDGPPPLP